VETWIVDWKRNERLPYYTRANAGEVLPDPASPLGWSLVFEEGLLPGWFRGFVEFGIYADGEFGTGPKIPMVGIFGGYFYLNLSHMRLLGLRLGADLDAFDADLLGHHPDTPPYEPHPDDVNPELSTKAAATIGAILAATSFPEIDADRARTARLVEQRPDLTTASDTELWEYARSMLPELDNGFARHDYSSLASTIAPGILAGMCSQIDASDLHLDLISGLGDVDSASPSWGLWDLSREVNASPRMTELFDSGIDAVLLALADPATPDERAFAESFDGFLRDYGSRGPNEWDIHALSWEADPRAPLILVDSIRQASDEDSPTARHERLAARRAAAADRLRAAFAGDPETAATLELALASTELCVPARERTKATCVAVINEVRMAMRELGRRGVEAGRFARPEDVMMLMSDEVPAYLADPDSFIGLINERLADYEELFDLDPPFIIASDPLPLSQWERRSSRNLPALGPGAVLSGLSGGAGRYTGRVCVVTDPIDIERLQPGDVLVAPFTDAAWTPLFLIAGAIVVDVGARNSHAVVVSRELGLPCVLSTTTGTQQLRDGMVVTVDGSAGTVTVDATDAVVNLA
jgi:phosphohistidine swiveling domain-containing protein